MQTTKIIIVLFIAIISFQFAQSQNGYSLEFEDVVTLSVDSLGSPSSGTTITKSFTVPSGTVLKISSGHISSYNFSPQNSGIYPPFKIVTGYLKINNNTIIGADSSMASTRFFNREANGSIFRIRPDEPIWAPSNSIVTIGVLISNADYIGTLPLFSNWISGVIFRKVPN